MLEFLKAPFFVLHFSYYINDLRDDFIFNIAIYADNAALYSECDQASDLWQQLVLASVLELDLKETIDWSGKVIVDFITYCCENGWACS